MRGKQEHRDSHAPEPQRADTQALVEHDTSHREHAAHHDHITGDEGPGGLICVPPKQPIDEQKCGHKKNRARKTAIERRREQSSTNRGEDHHARDQHENGKIDTVRNRKLLEVFADFANTRDDVAARAPKKLIVDLYEFIAWLLHGRYGNVLDRLPERTASRSHGAFGSLDRVRGCSTHLATWL